jgi:hypothetical protein
MVQTSLKSIVYNLESGKSQIKPTIELSIPISDQLAVFRNANIFTSGFTVINSIGEYFFQLEEHYNRLLESYRQIYECSQMEIDITLFSSLIKKIINENKQVEKPKRLLILITGGSAKSIGKKHEAYDNGLFGRAKNLFIIVNEKKEKPRWTFLKGVNVFTFPFQRSFASAKLTSYQGGIIAQSTINVINFLTIAKLLMSDYYNSHKLDKVLIHRWLFQELSRQIRFYHQLSLNQQTRYRLFINDLREGILGNYESEHSTMEALLRNVYSISSKQLVSIAEFIDDKTKLKELQKLENVYVKNLLHESVFTTFDSQPFFLEGPTFSIMGIDQEGHLRIVPQENNTYTKHNENDGVILESLSMNLVKKLISIHKIPYIERPIAVEEAKYMGALFAVSATRVQIGDTISFQPIFSVNGRTLPEPSEKARQTYNVLIHHFSNYVESYSYS